MSAPSHPDPAPPLTCRRDDFDLPPGETWLNSAYMGPLPRRVQQAGVEALARRAFPLGLTASDFFAPAERVRVLAAGLLDADPERTAFVTTASSGLAVVAHNLPVRAGQNVVVLGDQFPSNVHPWRRWRSQGVTVRTVAAPAWPPGADIADPATWQRRRAAWNDAVVAAVDRDTVLLAVEPAHWTDGTRFDLDRFGAAARAVGAAFVIDATQVGGVTPLSARRLQADALVVHAYKSMLSNYGLGVAVYGERFADARPTEDSWLVRAGAEDFARLVDYRDDYAPGMRRHDTPLRANPVLIGMLEASCTLLAGWGAARIEAYLQAIARPAVSRLRAAGFGVADEADRAANLFGVALPAGLQPEAVRAALAAQRIHVSVRGSSVRVSPHVYNDTGDLSRLADALVAMR